MKNNFINKRILVTGGTGSFGSTFVKEMLKTNVREIRIFSRDEKKQFDMRNLYNDNRLKFIIGDVRDFKSILDATHKINFVFHAAALKQVPTCEFFPLEALKTNILGGENVMEACIANKVSKCVILSTDKAVYPINSMGMSKSFVEKIMTSKVLNNNTKSTIICATRYGNVMGSRGSVIPLFIEQLKNNNPVTITDLRMTRFMMSLDESIKLVLKAFKDGKNGDIFVLKSPSSTMVNLYNSLKKILNSKSKIKIVGIRNGEKLHETLISKEEMIKSVSQQKYYIVKTIKKKESYDAYFTKGKLNKKLLEYNSENAPRLNEKQLIKILKKLFF